MPTPVISSVTYDAAAGTLTISGSGLPTSSSLFNLDDLTLTGQVVPDAATVTSAYTLGSEGGGSTIVSTAASAIVISLGGYDAIGVAGVLDLDGRTAQDGTAYALTASPGWVSGAAATSNTDVTVSGGFVQTGTTLSATAGNIAQLNALIVAADSEATSGARITIGISGMIGITTELEAINLQSGVTLTISGTTPDAGLNGEGDQRGLFVYAGAVNVDDLVISGAVATGGRGDDGGGGGAGLGGGLFVADAVAYGAAEAGSVTLDGVTFAGDSAVGGKTGGGMAAAAAAAWAATASSPAAAGSARRRPAASMAVRVQVTASSMARAGPSAAGSMAAGDRQILD